MDNLVNRIIGIGSERRFCLMCKSPLEQGRARCERCGYKEGEQVMRLKIADPQTIRKLEKRHTLISKRFLEGGKFWVLDRWVSMRNVPKEAEFGPIEPVLVEDYDGRLLTVTLEGLVHGDRAWISQSVYEEFATPLYRW
jgi:hypothetical protein